MKERKSSKGLLFLAILLLTVISLVSCKEKFTDEEIKTAAAALITDAEEINQIFFGSGIPFSDEGKESYKQADKAWLEERGIQSTETLREMTRKVYSDSYSEYIFSIMLASVKTDTSIASYASYIDSEDGILVYSQRIDYIKGKLTYHTDEIEVVKKKGDYARVCVKLTVESLEGQKQERTKSFDMVKVGDSWFLNSGTFLTYNKSED